MFSRVYSARFVYFRKTEKSAEIENLAINL